MHPIKRTVLFLCLIFPVMTFGLGDRPEFTGKVESFKMIDHGIQVQTEIAGVQVIFYTPTVIRIRIAKNGFGEDHSYATVQSPSGNFRELKEGKDSLTLVTDSIRVIIMKNPFRIIFRNMQGTVISEDYEAMAVSWLGTEGTCYKRLFPGEKFLGLGEKTADLNRRGNKYENWNSDIPAYANNEDPLYQTIPFYIGVHDQVVYGIFLDNSYRTTFNFGASTDDQFSSFAVANGELNYYFFGSTNITGIIRDYTWLTGRMPLPPLWSLGYHQSRWGYYPESKVLSIAQHFRENKIPCDVIHLDIDYMDGYKIFTWSKERFPDPGNMIEKLNNMGFHVVTIVDPGIKIEKGYPSYEEGLKNDYFVKYPGGKNYTGNVWPGRCHFPDFTKPETRTWWGKSFSSLTNQGVDGFWNDMNEPSAWGQAIPNILEFEFDGHKTSMAQGHNIYGLEMSRATYEGTRELLNGKRPFILTRAGYAGIQRYSAVWTGDNYASDDHMLLSARMVTGLGLSGISFTGADIGGFIGNPSKELFARWLSLGVYTPFFRNHSAWDSKDKEPWSFGTDILDLSVGIISMRYKLLPYIYSGFYESAVNGLPLARSLAINYPFDERIYSGEFQNQYLFGSSMLVAPVSSGKDSAKVYLPEGDWYRLSTDELFKGNREIIVNAPLNDLPVFVIASGIIPLQSPVQYTGQKPSALLEIHIYNGSTPNRFVYYEDDGSTYDYEKGAYYRRSIVFDPARKIIHLEKAEGKYTSKFSAARLVLHNFREVKSLTVNEKNYTLKLKSAKVKTVEFSWDTDSVVIKY